MKEKETQKRDFEQMEGENAEKGRNSGEKTRKEKLKTR